MLVIARGAIGLAGVEEGEEEEEEDAAAFGFISRGVRSAGVIVSVFCSSCLVLSCLAGTDGRDRKKERIHPMA